MRGGIHTTPSVQTNTTDIIASTRRRKSAMLLTEAQQRDFIVRFIVAESFDASDKDR
jgi:hypothetical protein